MNGFPELLMLSKADKTSDPRKRNMEGVPPEGGYPRDWLCLEVELYELVTPEKESSYGLRMITTLFVWSLRSYS